MDNDQINLNLKNIAKFDKLPKNIVKKFVKNCICNLSSYTKGEETALLCFALDIDMARLMLIENFDKKQLKKIKYFLILRQKNMPLNKIAKKSYFYLDEFFINNDVLAPRKETEILVEKAIEHIKTLSKQEITVLDLCCGSGVIGLSIAKHSPSAKTYLVDISKQALKVTKKNAKSLQLLNQVKIQKSNMFYDLKSDLKFDIIVSNPPYIRTLDLKNLDNEVKNYDPNIALDGGEDGLNFYKNIAKNFEYYLKDEGVLFLEIGYDQLEDVKALFNDNKFTVDSYKDYSGNDRIVKVSIATN